MKTWVKTLMLAGMLGLCLTLTGCYIAPDDVNESYATGTSYNSVPFPTVAPTETVAVTPDTVVIESQQNLFPAQNYNQQGVIAVTDSAQAAPTPTPTPTQSGGTGGWSDWGTVSGTGATNPPAGTGGQSAPGGIGDTVQLVTRTPPPGSQTGSQSGAAATARATIQVVTAPPATPTPTPRSLQRGFTDSDEVRALQKRLRALGWYTGSADGDFGPATEAAVKAFQRANGLSADGKAGEKTLEKLNSSSAISKKEANATPTPKPKAKATAKPTARATKKPTATPRPTKRATATPRPTATPNLSKDYYLQKGSSGSRVRTLQNRLIALGYLAGRATGTYDDATEAAVLAFQKRTRSLYEDGIAGPDTLKALYADNAARASGSTAAAAAAAAESGGATLEMGSEGSAVRTLQRQLKKLGYYEGSVDGSFGKSTEAAVKAFQLRNDLTVDGKAGQATQRALYTEGAAVAYSALREGETGDAVKALQQALARLGYYDGKIDGEYGVTTSDAVRAFQIENKLTPVDGVAGSNTMAKLYSEDAVPAVSAKVDFESARPGDRSDLVVEIQECLVEQGYLDHVTGVYDDATTEAIKAFQRRKGLTADGVAGDRTLMYLFGY